MMNLRRAWRWSLLSAGALVAVALIGLIVVLLIVGLFHISIDAAPWRGRIADAMSQALGRQVTLEGPLKLVVGRHPALTVGSIRVANPAGFSAPHLATLGAAQLRVELLPLLRDQIHVLDVSAEDVQLRLESDAAGRVNWQFPKLAAQPSNKAVADAQPVRLEQIDRMRFRRINIEYVAGGRTRYFTLDELIGTGAQGKPLALTLKGTVEKQFPYTVTITGGALGDLYAQDKPWPVQLSLSFAGTAMQIDGNITNPTTDPAAQLTLGFGTEDLSQLERLLQTTFPAVGATALSGLVQWKSRHLDISNLRGVMGASLLEGELHLDLSGAKPRVTGELSLPVLDLGPFVGQPPSVAEQPSNTSDLQKAYAQMEARSYNLKELGLFDADLTLRIAKWIGIPGDVRDAQLRVTLDHAILKAPVQATVADVPVTGELDVDASAETPAFLLRVGAERSSLGRLAEVFARVRGVQGHLARLELQLKGQGANLGAVVRALDVRLDVVKASLSYGNVEGGRPVEFKVDALHIAIPPGGRLVGQARGSLLGTPFQTKLRGGDLPTLTREIRWPLELETNASGATLRIEGVVAPGQAQSGTELKFRLEARRVADVARWLGLSRAGSASLAMEGRVRVQSDEWRLSPFSLQVGRTALSADIARIGIGSRPLLRARVLVDDLDVEQLERMLPPPNPKAPVRSTIELPILPQGIDLFDSDVEVQVKRIHLRKAPVSDVSFSGHIREGRMWPSPFSAKIADTQFSGAVALDLRGQLPQASLWVAAEQADLGRLLRQLGAVQDLDARVALLRMELIGRGSRLGEMLERSSLLAEMETGEVKLRDPNGKWEIPVKIQTGTARADAGKPVTLDLDGTIDATPVTIRIASGALRDFMNPGGRVPFSLAAAAAQTQLELKGSAALPITQREVQLSLSVRGKRLDHLNELARVALPPWGPWELDGQFRASDTGYQVSELSLHVGDSSLNGHGSLDTTPARPRLEVTLSAPRIQLNDFKLDGWSAFPQKPKADKPLSVEEIRSRTAHAAQEGQKLLSPEVMRKLDAQVDVDVSEVVSGTDRLGSGSLRARLLDGRLALDPAELNVPGGSARLAFAFQPSETEVTVSANVRVDRFDYGILARRIKADTDLQGLFSLRLDLDARAPALESVMQHANGRVDVAVWPRNLKAGIFDLWAVNLFVALLPAVDPAAGSQVNCGIGSFDIRNGKLSHDQILLDTSRMRVTGQGKVDFATEQLSFRLVPKPKNPQFFSLATPVQVTGTITDFKIGVSTSDVLETTARLFTSVIVVPLQKLVGRGLPRDGGDVCENALRQTGG